MFKAKKLLSLFVGAVMTANVFATMPFTAFADEEIERTYTYDDYEVTYDVTNSWGNTELIAVTLSNTSDTTIENWMLYFEPNGQVHNVVNASESYTSTGTAYFRNSWYNANVEPNSSTTFNYMVDDCSGIPDEFVLCQTRAEKETGYDVSIKVNETWGNSFNGEIILQNNTESAIEAWELMVDTNFTITEITNSWAATVTELEPYSYMLKGTYTGFVPANSSVSLGFTGVMDGEPEISNYSLTEVVVDENLFRSPESINPVVDGDLENDTIYAEAIYDSENENINISWTATSPGTFFEIYVSDDNINYELYETVDGNIFNTSYNTVDDFLIKYFKVKQILPDTENINAIYSNICYAVYTPNGVDWKEHLRPWTIDDSNEVLSKINTDDNPYKLSLEFNAAGIPDIHLNVVESYYTNALNNDAVLGMASEIIYKDDLKIQDLVVKYEINDNYTDNELGILENNSEFSGIKRLNVFKYFEDINMLLPIETKFDLTNNIVYTEVDEPGTYCIVDMEKWLSQFDVDIDKLNTLSATPSVFSLRSDETEDASANSFVAENTDVNVQDNSNILLTNENVIDVNEFQTLSDDSENTDINISNSDIPIDVFFVLQSAGETGSFYLAEKEMILCASEKIFSTYTNARIYVIGFTHNDAEFLKNNDSDPDYFSSIDEMDCLNNYEYKIYEDGYVNRTPAYEKLLNEVEYRENSKNFVFTIYNGSTDCQGADQIEICRSLDINYSELLTEGLMYANTERASNVLDEVIKSNGICIMYDENSANVIYNHICDNMQLSESENIEDKIYFGMDWSEMNLSAPLQAGGTTDTDNDGLTDWEEVNSYFFENCKNDIYITEELLPSAWYMLKSKYNCIPYRYINSNNFEIFEILNMIKVLPVISNPTKESSADDGVNDFDKLKPECIFDKYKSEYYNDEAENYDYYNDSDYYYEHLDDRYKHENIKEAAEQESETTEETTKETYIQGSTFKEYTVESLFPELNNKNLNSEATSTYIEVDGNDITIHARVMFWDEFDGTVNERETKIFDELARNYLNDIQDDDNRTIREVIIYGLEHYWQKSFEGSIFDFYPGMKINTYLNIQDDTGREGYSYSTESHDDELYIVVSSDNGASYMLPNYMRINVSTYPTEITNLARGVAHEFGHILGLFDYYSNDGNEVPVIDDSVQKKSEIRMFGLMNSAATYEINTVPNDIEMALYGAIDNTFSCSQRFIPERKNENIPDGQEKISMALREKIMYANCPPDEIVNDPTSYNSKIRYEWAEEKYFIPVNSEIKTNEFFKYAKGDECAVIIDVAEGFENVETLEIPSTIEGISVVKISNYAFKDKNSLKSVTLPSELTDIGISAFENCSKLAEADLPKKLEYIRQGAFKNCALTKAEIPSCIKIINDFAFEDCMSLQSITVAEGNDKYYSEDEVLFSYKDKNNSPFTTLVKYPAANDKKEYVIPDNVTKINNKAFFGASNLKSITIPESVEEIGTSTFNECNSLQSITVVEDNNYYCSEDGVLFNKEKTNLIKYPANKEATLYELTHNVIKIEDSAFKDCNNLINIILPNSVKEINAYAFKNCQNLTDFTIPENVEFIGYCAFSDCYKLGDIVIPENVKQIDICAFNKCWYSSNGNVTFKRKYDFIYDSKIFWNDFNVSITIPFDAKDNYTNDDGTIIFEHVSDSKVSFE